MGEAQLFKNWLPLTKVSEIVTEVSHLRKLAYFRFNLPWPFYYRECFVQACGTILKDEQAAALSMSTVNEDSWLGTPVNKNKDYVSADINKALIYAKIIDDNTTLVKIIVNADPHIDYIP